MGNGAMENGGEGPVRQTGRIQRTISDRFPSPLEPQSIEYRERNEKRKFAVLPHTDPATPDELQENCLAGILYALPPRHVQAFAAENSALDRHLVADRQQRSYHISKTCRSRAPVAV